MGKMLVVTANVAVVSPSATVTLAGTWTTAGTLLVRLTTVPPANAGPFSVTMPWDGLPLETLAGLRATKLTASGNTIIVTVAVFEGTPPEIA
jgi:hypothetical protein